MISAMPTAVQTIPIMPTLSTIAKAVTIMPKTVPMTAHARGNQSGDVKITAIIIRITFDLLRSGVLSDA